jgi:hypothetical protein
MPKNICPGLSAYSNTLNTSKTPKGNLMQLQTNIVSELKSKYNYNDLIFDRLIFLLNHYIHKHGKTLVVRFDLRYPAKYFSMESNHICPFVAKLVQKYKRLSLDPYYMWTREQNIGEHPHYHCLILLNGNKVRSFHHVFENARNLWGSTIGDPTPGLVHHCTADCQSQNFTNGIMIVRSSVDFHNAYNQVVIQASYIAKAAYKRSHGDPWRNFGMSELQ